MAINTLKALAIDVYTGFPILAHKTGGLSGKALKPVGVRAVYDLYQLFGDKLPIIGVGGIDSMEDVVEYLMAGATAVEIGTAFAYAASPEEFTADILTRLHAFLIQFNIKQIEALTGFVHRNPMTSLQEAFQ